MSNSQEPKQLSTSQRLLIALNKATAKLEAVEKAKNEPIAIVGMGCRFPGAENPEAFWQLLHDGVDAITPVPRERWNIDAYYDANPDTPGKMYTRYGGFIDDVDRFDPQFFGISPREAKNLDPQQRLLLEVSWEALENGGQIPADLAESKTGVFVGVTTNDYAKLLMPKGDLDRIDTYYLTGNPLNAIAGRVSYTLGLHGPSMAVDTACSSSLVSVHLACQSLRNRECDRALAGGVNLILAPDNTVALCRARMMSANGRCKTFDAGADGFVRGEGCGVLLLKRLSNAVADRDKILALIRGSGVNQDGASSGFTVPNKSAQEALIARVITAAKVEPEDIDYVEAHGTGTSLGDPIEIKALAKVLGKRSLEHPLKIGSVKTNIGHLESAAGVAGLIKTILSLKNETIPPSLHFNRPNPYIDWDKLPVRVVTENQNWSRSEKPRLAGVSSFGASGTNAHILLEEAPTIGIGRGDGNTDERPLHLLTLSAKSDAALMQLAKKYQQYLTTHSRRSWADICFSANTGRTAFDHRLCVLAADSVAAREKLSRFTRGETVAGITTGISDRSNQKIAMLFTGQGSQYMGMGRELYHTHPTFRQTLDRCAVILEPYLERSLLDVIFEEQTTLDLTEYTQPALFALEYALYTLWQSWGVTPDIVMGHSVGEYVAATVAGVFGLEDGLKLIAARGKLMQALPQNGSMVAVLASEETVRKVIEPYRADVAIAAINGNDNIVISGKNECIEQVVQTFNREEIKTKPLRVSHAFHSPLMQPMLARWEGVVNKITYSVPKLKLVSNLTGKLADSNIATSQYWIDHVVRPVRFAEGMRVLEEQKCQLYLEIGAKPILLGMARRCLDGENNKVWLPSLRPDRSNWQQMLDSLSSLYLQGIHIDWQWFDRHYSRTKVELPTYAFQRQRYWADYETSSSNGSNNGNNGHRATSVTELLDSGNIEQLSRQIATSERLSELELQSLPKLLNIIVARHKQQLTTVSVRDSLYKINWLQQPFRAKTQFARPGEWLILADRQGVAEALAELLQQHQQKCILVHAGNQIKDNYTLDPGDPQAFERLVRDLDSLAGVINCWSLDAPDIDELSVNCLEQSQLLNCGSTLHLLQALLKYKVSINKLWLITGGTVAVHSDGKAIAQAPLWGMGKVIAQEHPELWGGAIDLDPEIDIKRQAENIFAELSQKQSEQIAFRDRQRYIARLQPAQPKVTAALRIHPDATYLITGGLGAIAIEVAGWLLDRGAKYLVLTSRSGASEQNLEAIAELEQRAKIVVAKADAANESEMSALFSKIAASLPPLKGVFHAAGTLADGVLQRQTWQNFERVMAAKVSGAWMLHCLTRDLPLDYFVCFSSVSALLGSPGQGNYAAANTFLDALAHYRRGLGLPALSIDWGAWEKAGMAANLADRDRSRIADKGMELISPQLGLQTLEYLLTTDAVQVGVMPVDWDKFRQQFPQGIPPFLSDLVSDTPQSSVELTLLQQLKSATISDRRQLLIDSIRTQVSRSMGLEAADIDIKTGFSDLGMDSLMAVELRNYLQTNLETAIAASLAFDYPTVEALANYLLQEVLVEDTTVSKASEVSQPKSTTNIESDLDRLSDEEAEAILLGKLNNMKY